MRKFLLLSIVLFFTYPLFSQAKTALIIGNGDYKHFSTLSNPVDEARDMRNALQRIGFEVILLTDGTEDEIYDAITLFEDKLKAKGGLALFHYGGHGVQVNGSNYLIPVNADIPDERRVKSRAVDVEEIVSAMASSGSRTNIIILDACRDNPLPGESRSASRGLAVIGNQPPDSIIVYSADAGTTAQDGLFTPTLLKYIETPGLEFYDILKKVRTEVREASGGMQRTGDYNQLESDIYLAGRGSGSGLIVEREEFGSLRISVFEPCEVFIDGRPAGSLEANSSAVLNDVKTGSRTVEAVYREGRETLEVRIYKNETSEAAFKQRIKKESPVDENNLVRVSGGTVEMGALLGDSDEKPTHFITVSDFIISRYEVTQKEYEAVMGRNPSDRNYSYGDDYPVNKVSWLDAIEFCNKLSLLEGLEPCYSGRGRSLACDFDANGYRLPTEAEWFFAAGGGTVGQAKSIYAGANLPGPVSWYDNNSSNTVHPVGLKNPNELGLYDMSGNVAEWCWDYYGEYTSSLKVDPTGPEEGRQRVVRGGGWNNLSTDGRINKRKSESIAGKSFNLGFRIVRRE
ncbi:SUMF1/EgtB/PvdO family nonheme iron enzyme [Spirochaeta isovalerica]|uniref:Formylglycine-generating enzyme required for sulfatase activity n=1 Tax=Spirochaeta isovalerica TaxID=150 RepID=A0A841RJG8_9SPIO|nr:SUMF1/EgtB/PvdO family nonheme iron enzyme [Spirochaeta isovalerica]MBB6482648.1 formylglycine-generating enzyme required for sulfatase activity [Spirochaeta isovalerica]